MNETETDILLNKIRASEQQVNKLETVIDNLRIMTIELKDDNKCYEEDIADLKKQSAETGYLGVYGTLEQREWAKEFVDEYNNYKY